MLKRVLEDITNVKNKNIKVTIRREERPIRREITQPFLEYAETYYNHTNKPLVKYEEIERKYAGKKEPRIYEEIEQEKKGTNLRRITQREREEEFDRIFQREGEMGERQSDRTEMLKESLSSITDSLNRLSSKTDLNRLCRNSIGQADNLGLGYSDILSVPVEIILRGEKIGKYTPEKKKAKIIPEKEIVPKRKKTDENLSSDEVQIESESESEEQIEKVTAEMRKTLLEWMYDVKVDYKISSTAYQTAVRITDKYFTVGVVRKEKYQLLGATSLFIANKLVDCKSTPLKYFVEVCDGAFTREEFLLLEREILVKIGNFLNFLLPMQIIKEDRFLLGNALTKYSSEVILLDISYGTVSPKELSNFIEKNVVAILTDRNPSEIFKTLLTQSPGILDHQIKQVKDIISEIR